jgi:hypothetical protein
MQAVIILTKIYECVGNIQMKTFEILFLLKKTEDKVFLLTCIV